MPGVRERLAADLRMAVKERDAQRTSALRLLSAAIQNEELAAERGGPLPEPDLLRVIEREAKRRQEAAHAYAQGSRPEAAAKERAEETILRAYLPAQLDDADIESVVRQVLSSTESPSDVGMVMRDVMGKLRGRADGARVRSLVSRILGK